MLKQPIRVLCVALLVLLFVYNGLDKLMAGPAFAGELNNQPLPNAWTLWLEYTIPAIDLLLAAALIYRRTERKATASLQDGNNF